MYNYSIPIRNILQPCVYRIINANNTANTVGISNSNYTLEYVSQKFNVPDKLYGDIKQNAVRIWNDYALGNKSTGCLLLGDKGTGKTLLGSIISNIALDNNIPVVLVTEIKATIELIQFLAKLNNCVLLLDEFNKNLTYDLQSMMLTMFSDVFNTRKLFIITENSERAIQSYILDRPGRIKYRLDFSKLSKKTFEDYVGSFIKNKEFLNDLTQTYKAAVEFSFDQLAAIVNEHLNYPDDSLNDLLEILNVKSLRKRIVLNPMKVADIRNPEKSLQIKIYGQTDIDQLKFGRGAIYEIFSKDGEKVLDGIFQFSDLEILTDNEYVLTRDNIKIYFEKTYE